jgi:hypothetical protein
MIPTHRTAQYHCHVSQCFERTWSFPDDGSTPSGTWRKEKASVNELFNASSIGETDVIKLSRLKTPKSAWATLYFVGVGGKGLLVVHG